MDKPAERHRIVLTGATGMLGRAILRELAARPDATVLALSRNRPRPTDPQPNARSEVVDYFDAPALGSLLAEFRPTVMIHCAATGMQTPRSNWTELVRVNVNLSVQLCELVAPIPGCGFVFISTGLAYADQGRPLREDDPLETRHPYAATKVAGETLLRAAAAERGVPMTILRPFSFTGPGDAGTKLFPSLLRAAAEGRPLDLSPGDQRRDHCAVADIARGVVSAALRKVPSPEAAVFNLGSGVGITLRELIERIVAELGLAVTLNFGTRESVRFEPKHFVADVSRARARLGWQPQTNLAHAVWQLARESFPSLNLREPRRML